MLVHLDDQNVDVYDGVNESLEALIRVNKSDEKDILGPLENAVEKN